MRPGRPFGAATPGGGATAAPPAAVAAGSNASFALLFLGSIFIYLDALVPISRYNFHISDILFSLSFAAVLVAPGARRRFVGSSLREPLLWAFATLAAVWLLGLALAARGGIMGESAWVLGVLQLAYDFFILAPLMFFHARFARRHRALWLGQCAMLAFAGLLSLTEYMGITHLQVQSYFRVINPLRGLNGLYFFGLASAYLLQFAVEEFPRPATWGYLTLWVCGFLGVALGVIRQGLVLTILSLLAVVWWRRRRILSHPRMAIGLVALTLLAVGGGSYIALRISPGLRDRVQNGSSSSGIWYIGDRVEVARVAWQEILQDPQWFGEGVGQFMIQHPEIGITVHDALLQQLFEVGIVGLLVWLCIWWLMWRTPYRQYRQAQATKQPRAVLHWWCCQFAILCFFLANISTPTGISRSEWLLPLLAVGTWRLWPAGALEKPARTRTVLRARAWTAPAMVRARNEVPHVRP